VQIGVVELGGNREEGSAHCGAGLHPEAATLRATGKDPTVRLLPYETLRARPAIRWLIFVEGVRTWDDHRIGGIPSRRKGALSKLALHL